MAGKTILLKALEFTIEELECLLKTAIKLLYIDGEDNPAEWNYITLLPALMEIEQQNAPEELKAEWRKKLETAGNIIRNQDPNQAIDEINIKGTVREREKQETFLLMLFLIAFADNKLNKIELDFIINNIAQPWGFYREDLTAVISNNREIIMEADEIIRLIEQIMLI